MKTPASYAKSLFDAMPQPIIVVDDDLRVIDHNEAATALLAVPAPLARGQRGGNLLECINAFASADGCGRSAVCIHCGLRNALRSAVQGERRVRSQALLRVVHRGVERDQHFAVTVAPFHYRNTTRWMIVLEDRNELVELQGMIPVCPSCKEPRTDPMLRKKAASYLRRHWESDFTSCLCRDCADRLFGNTKAPTPPAG